MGEGGVRGEVRTAEGPQDVNPVIQLEPPLPTTPVDPISSPAHTPEHHFVSGCFILLPLLVIIIALVAAIVAKRWRAITRTKDKILRQDTLKTSHPKDVALHIP